MIKKIFILLMLLLCLAGCQADQDQFVESIDSAIHQATSMEMPSVEKNNCIKTYYTYYLDKNIGKLDGDEVSNQFKINGNLACLTLDVSSITLNHVEANANEYTLRDIGTLENKIYDRTGRFFNSSGKMINYKLAITALEDEIYFVLIQTPTFTFVCKVTSGTCANTVHDMLILLRSTVVNDTQVIYDFASENIVKPTSNVITLFKQSVPENGYIVDYLDDWKNDKTFITIQKEQIQDGPQQDYQETLEGDNSFNPNRDDEDNNN